MVPSAIQVLGLADVKLPALPAVAPGRFADQLQTWPRQALALAALGTTGWSMRLAIADLMSANLTTVKSDAGSLRRAFQVLARRQFWIEQKVTVAGVHKPDLAEADDTTLILVRLAPLGHEVLRACGIAPVPSEWDLLLASHGGAAQTAHAGLVCTFTYHARLRGWATAVCPPATGPSQPDVLLRREGAELFVEVEGESGEAERRMIKWQRQARTPGPGGPGSRDRRDAPAARGRGPGRRRRARAGDRPPDPVRHPEVTRPVVGQRMVRLAQIADSELRVGPDAR